MKVKIVKKLVVSTVHFINLKGRK